MASANSLLLSTFVLSLVPAFGSASPSPVVNGEKEIVSSPSVSGNWPSSSANSEWASSGSTASTYYTVPSHFDAVRIAHVVLGSWAVLIVLPMGSIVVTILKHKYGRGIRHHARIQMAGYLVYVAASGLGIWMARSFSLVNGGNQYLHPKLYHPIIGMIVLGLLFFLPFTQLVNHLLFKTHPKVVRLAYVHIWVGRLLLLLAIVNGGLGFAFADQIPGNTWSKAPRITYGAVATVVVFTYVAICGVWDQVQRERRASQTSDAVREEEMQGLSRQPPGEGLAGVQAGTDTRPQTAQTEQTESTTGGVFKSSAL